MLGLSDVVVGDIEHGHDEQDEADYHRYEAALI
jgi:hypothetical protein